MNYYDIRPAYLLWEHKKSMLMRIEYMQRHKIIDTDNDFNIRYKEIQESSKVIQNLLIKYFIKNDKKILNKALFKITEIANAELNILNRILTEISNNIEKSYNK